LLVSRDSGATWAAPSTDLPYYNVQRLAAGSDGAIYAIANNFGTKAFALKLDPSGSNIVYSTYLGGSGTEWGQGIAVDEAGRAYLTGATASFDFPVLNSIQPHPGGLRDGYVAVLDPTGSHLLWSSYLGGSEDDVAWAIAVDPAGNVHLTGWTYSADFPLRQPSQTRFLGNSSNANAFAAKLKGDGSSFIFSTYFGGGGGDSAWSVAADAAGNTYIGGDTSSQYLPLANPIQTSLAGQQNVFVAAWDGQTGALRYGTYLGGSGEDYVGGIAADAAGNVYVAGSTTSPDFPRKYPYQYNLAGENAFLAKIAPGATGPSIALTGAANAASYGAVLAPGEIVSIFGKALAITPASAGAAPLPSQLSDVRVSVNGLAAPLFYASPTQINAQIPFETPTGAAQIQVTSTAGTGVLTVQVATTAPAIFTLNALGTGPGAIEHGATGQLVTSDNPAAGGEIVAVFRTGLGAVNPAVATGAAAPIPPPQAVASVQASIAGAPARVTYAGVAPGFAGLYQVNVEIPAGVPAGAQMLQISAGALASNTVAISVR
jgi:uncharacterized protein (TIGR03437 family)